jgi:hypothetical protein
MDRRPETLIRNTSSQALACERIEARNLVLLLMLIQTCLRWLLAPLMGMKLHGIPALRDRIPAVLAVSQHPLPLAPIHAPPPRLLI